MYLTLDLNDVEASVAGPKRPQDRITLSELKQKFTDLLQKPVAENGYNKSNLDDRFLVKTGDHPVAKGGGDQQALPPDGKSKDTSLWTETEMINNRPTPDRVRKGSFPEGIAEIGHGSVLIAAITSCTNTSNPSVMIAAGSTRKKSS